ncbi:MAG: RsmE family RNA methyltransferase [Candidatus Eremiobacteraeota bacterium]|nr:RsmE family RNA methyltransferase [Candidatus Eremiobacteraeota bacterium]
MSAPRVFVSQSCSPSALIELDRNDARHLALVLRMKAGEHITIVSQKMAWQAQLTEIDGERAIASILVRALQPSSELPVDVAVLQAVPKGAKMDAVIEKVVELGATSIVPIRCTRSYGGDSPQKVDRWRRIARAAAQQSQRLVVPDVEQAMSFNDAIARFSPTSQLIVAWEEAEKSSLAAALQRKTARPIAIAIGPEGSFTSEELQRASAAGCDLASLGRTILRTETAAAAMVAAIAALRGWW